MRNEAIWNQNDPGRKPSLGRDKTIKMMKNEDSKWDKNKASVELLIITINKIFFQFTYICWTLGKVNTTSRLPIL
jgi:hypothetical protein